MDKMEFSVPCLFGLEGLAGDELRRLDLENVRVENGRVLFSGDEIALAKANVCLRGSGWFRKKIAQLRPIRM